MSTIVLIGAGAVGAATALHLAEADPGLDVVLVEADPTFTRSATGRGTGGIRQLLHPAGEHPALQYTLDVVENWAEWASIDGRPAEDLQWQAKGYLFVAGADDLAHLRTNYATQIAYRVNAEWLEPAELGARYPEIRIDDLTGAVLSPRDGWLDPKVFFAAVQAKARDRGPPRS